MTVIHEPVAVTVKRTYPVQLWQDLLSSHMGLVTKVNVSWGICSVYIVWMTVWKFSIKKCVAALQRQNQNKELVTYVRLECCLFSLTLDTLHITLYTDKHTHWSSLSIQGDDQLDSGTLYMVIFTICQSYLLQTYPACLHWEFEWQNMFSLEMVSLESWVLTNHFIM